VRLGHFVCLRKWGWGFGARNPKPSCYDSVSGAPMETVVEVDGRRWWVGGYKKTIVSPYGLISIVLPKP
jgi:hypothetical protein